MRTVEKPLFQDFHKALVFARFGNPARFRRKDLSERESSRGHNPIAEYWELLRATIERVLRAYPWEERDFYRLYKLEPEGLNFQDLCKVFRYKESRAYHLIDEIEIELTRVFESRGIIEPETDRGATKSVAEDGQKDSRARN